jgi:FkbM family methyltransferase
MQSEFHDPSQHRLRSAGSSVVADREELAYPGASIGRCDALLPVGHHEAMHVLGVEVHRSPPRPPYGELARLFELLRIDHVIDVGANDGQYGRGLRDAAKFAGRIDSVEPQPESIERLRTMTDSQWHVHPVALGATTGNAVLHVYRDTSLSSLHRLNDVGRGVWDDPSTAEETQQIEVTVQTVDDLLDSIPMGNRVWLKIDTQGHDLEVLAGLRKHVNNIVGLQSEVAFIPLYENAPDALDHIRTITNLGFALAGFVPIGRIDGAAITEADCLFVRMDSVEVLDTNKPSTFSGVSPGSGNGGRRSVP